MGPSRRHAGRDRPGEEVTNLNHQDTKDEFGAPRPEEPPQAASRRGAPGQILVSWCLGGSIFFASMTTDTDLHDTVTYLEMTERPPLKRRPHPAAKLALIPAEPCSVSFYRYLYPQLPEPPLSFHRPPLPPPPPPALT